MRQWFRLTIILPYCFFISCYLLIHNPAFSTPVIKKYDLTYRFDFSKQKLFCVAELSLDRVQPGDTLNLLLYRLLKVNSIKDDQDKVITFSQTVTSFTDWEKLQVNHIAIPVKTTKIIIYYEGYLMGYTETGMLYVKDNINPNFTILRMDGYAYPIQGIPTWEKNSAVDLPNFDYTVSVTIPDSLTVVNGGTLSSKDVTNGQATYIYHNRKPAWRIDIAISKYATLTDNDLSIYYFPRDSSGAKVVADYCKKACATFNNWFGTIDFPGYSIIEIPDDWGSQAEASYILQTASAFKNETRLYELYHEISHIWNVRPNDANPCRLESEGLAVFLQYLLVEKLQNKTAAVDSAAEITFQRLKKRVNTDSTVAHTPIIDYGKKQMTGLSYTKGMLFYYLLYKTTGETAFMNTIKTFYAKYRATGATTEEFAQFLVSTLKNAKVEALVKDWIKTDQSSQQILRSQSVKELVTN